VFISFVLLLTGCGFHLRGSVELDTSLQALAVRETGGTTVISAELRRILLAQGVDIRDSAPMVLQLHSESSGRRVLSVDSQGRATEYDLRYGVTFSLLDVDGVAIIDTETITAHRDMQFDPNAVLGSNTEETRLREDMRREVANRILLRLDNAKPPAATQ